jgi:thymidylate synthase (FAD)
MIKVLDKGFVRLEEFSGGDAAVLRAARVSYGSSSVDETRDKKLIKFLLDNEHGSPSEHNLFTFHMKHPILVARQIIRHRVGISFNEVSGRYTEMKDEFYIPTVWRAQDTKNKQGSVAADLDHVRLTNILIEGCAEDMARYRAMLSLGVAKEMARMVLPVNLYTQWYMSMNARSLMHLISLRSDQHAQAETRQYSHAMALIFQSVMPWTFEAFADSLRARTNRDYTELWAYLDAAKPLTEAK